MTHQTEPQIQSHRENRSLQLHEIKARITLWLETASAVPTDQDITYKSSVLVQNLAGLLHQLEQLDSQP